MVYTLIKTLKYNAVSAAKKYTVYYFFKKTKTSGQGEVVASAPAIFRVYRMSIT